MEEPSDAGRPAHLSAASGIVRRATYVYVIGDDELHLGVFDISSDRPGHLQRVLEGERRGPRGALEGEAGPRGAHPAALRGQSVRRAPRPRFGIEDAPRPRFRLRAEDDGGLADEPREVSLEPVYSLLREHVAELNVEGAATIEDRLWLLRRGNSEVGSNLVAELSLDEVMRSLRDDLTIDAHELEGVRSYDLGEIEGVELTFSDATPIAERLLVFTASAEAEDGTIRGVPSSARSTSTAASAGCARSIGAGRSRACTPRSTRGVLDFTFVCDQDDPDAPSRCSRRRCLWTGSSTSREAQSSRIRITISRMTMTVPTPMYTGSPSNRSLTQPSLPVAGRANQLSGKNAPCAGGGRAKGGTSSTPAAGAAGCRAAAWPSRVGSASRA